MKKVPTCVFPRLALAPAMAGVCLVIGLGSAAANQSEPRQEGGTHTGVSHQAPLQVIDHTAKQVLAVLQDRRLASSEKVARIEAIADEHFDFETVSRLVLARHWSELDEDQKREFVRQFKKHLSITYGRNVDRYEDGQIELVGDREEARGDWTVKSRIFHHGEHFLVDYRLRKNSQAWRIIDVLVEGTSLVSNFRSQFQEIIASRGSAHLIELLRQKNASGQSIIKGSQSPGSRS